MGNLARSTDSFFKQLEDILDPFETIKRRCRGLQDSEEECILHLRDELQLYLRCNTFYTSLEWLGSANHCGIPVNQMYFLLGTLNAYLEDNEKAFNCFRLSLNHDLYDRDWDNYVMAHIYFIRNKKDALMKVQSRKFGWRLSNLKQCYGSPFKVAFYVIKPKKVSENDTD
jgi:hypothetical protein